MGLTLCLLLFVKNETVNGINGKTQGVSRAIKPPSSPSKKILSKPFSGGTCVSAGTYRMS